jgi:hypothetical protein
LAICEVAAKHRPSRSSASPAAVARALEVVQPPGIYGDSASRRERLCRLCAIGSAASSERLEKARECRLITGAGADVGVLGRLALATMPENGLLDAARAPIMEIRVLRRAHLLLKGSRDAFTSSSSRSSLSSGPAALPQPCWAAPQSGLGSTDVITPMSVFSAAAI